MPIDTAMLIRKKISTNNPFNLNCKYKLIFLFILNSLVIFSS